MSLTSLLANPASPVAHFFDLHCDPAATTRFLAKQERKDPITDPGSALSEMAFLYWLRWQYEPFHPTNTFGWLGAKLLDKRAEYTKLVWDGNFSADKRRDSALVMASYEMYARTGHWHEDHEYDLLDIWWDNLPDKLLNPLYRYQHAPLFSGSAHVGGAHGSMILDSTLLEICACADHLDRDTFVRGIAHLVLDFNNELGVNNLAFYFPHCAQLLIFPIPSIVRNIGYLRRKFQEQVQPVRRKYFDRHCTEYLGFERYDFDHES